MNAIRTAAALILCASSAVALADPPRHGDHPAVVVQRLQAHAGYDYASKFYAHPAMLFLRADAPLGEHPAVAVQRLQAHAGYDYASKMYPHPAWMFLSAEAPLDAQQMAQATGNAR